MRQQELCDEIPDRIANPHEYQQLPQNNDNNEDEDRFETDDVPIIGAYTNDYGSIQQ